MWKHVLLVVAIGALVAVSAVGVAVAAGGERPVTVKVGDLELTANGGFSPTALSKTEQTPIELKASGEVKEADGSHPPAAREIIIEGDKNAEVHVKGIPTCSSGQLQATSTSVALAACKSALIGEGSPSPDTPTAPSAPWRCEDPADDRRLDLALRMGGPSRPPSDQPADPLISTSSPRPDRRLGFGPPGRLGVLSHLQPRGRPSHKGRGRSAQCDTDGAALRMASSFSAASISARQVVSVSSSRPSMSRSRLLIVWRETPSAAAAEETLYPASK